jgi:hypothetical protein
VKPSYILKVTYPIAAVMAKIHSLAIAMRALRSMVFITYEIIVKPSYILKVTSPIAAVMAKIHSLAVAMRAPRSMVVAVCNT